MQLRTSSGIHVEQRSSSTGTQLLLLFSYGCWFCRKVALVWFDWFIRAIWQVKKAFERRFSRWILDKSVGLIECGIGLQGLISQIHIYFLWVFLAYQNTSHSQHPRGTQLKPASERRNGAMLFSSIWVISNVPSHSHELSLHRSAGKTISSTSTDTCLLPLKRAVFEWESLHLSAATRWENAK